MYDEFGGGIKAGYMGALRKLYRSIDKNGDGHISYDEFVRGMNEHPILLKALLEAGPSVEETAEAEAEWMQSIRKPKTESSAHVAKERYAEKKRKCNLV